MDDPAGARGPGRGVVFLIQRFRPRFTGMGIQIERLGRRLQERGTRVAVITDRHPDAPDHETGPGLAVHRVPLPVTRNPFSLAWKSRPLLARLRDLAPEHDVLHIQGAPPVLPRVVPAARKLGYRVAITSTLLRSDDPLSIRDRGRMARWRFRAYRSADGFVAISRALAETYPAAGIDPARVREIPIGVPDDLLTVSEDPAAEAAALGWEGPGPRALFVGAVLARKGVDILLDAWERVLASVPGAELIVAGPDRDLDDPELDRFAAACLARSRRPPLAGRVRFCGRVDDPSLLARMMRAADLFVFPTRMEGFGIVIAEAMALETPPVVSRIPGITDRIVEHDRTGLLVDPDDAAGLAGSVVELLRDPDRRARLGREARQAARERYAITAVAGEYERFYREVLDRAGISSEAGGRRSRSRR